MEEPVRAVSPMPDAPSLQTSRNPHVWWALFAFGLIVRLLVLIAVVDLPTTIVDEQHYARIAMSVMSGDGFGWGPGSPTWIRPPLYPGALAAVWTAIGGVNLQIVRALQIALAGLTAVIVYWLGTRAFDARVGRLAALIFWLYPSFIFFNTFDPHRNALHPAARGIRATGSDPGEESKTRHRVGVRCHPRHGRSHAQCALAPTGRVLPSARAPAPQDARTRRSAGTGVRRLRVCSRALGHSEHETPGRHDRSRHNGRTQPANGQLRAYAGRSHVGRRRAAGVAELGLRPASGISRPFLYRRPEDKWAQKKAFGTCSPTRALPCGGP